MSEAKQGSSAPPWLDPVLQTGLEAVRILRGTVRGKISLALVVGGVAFIGGNWIEAVASAAWEVVFGRPIAFPEVSPLYGVLLISFGIGFYGWTARDERRASAVMARPTVAMIRHESMEAVTQPLRASALPAELGNADMPLRHRPVLLLRERHPDRVGRGGRTADAGKSRARNSPPTSRSSSLRATACRPAGPCGSTNSGGRRATGGRSTRLPRAMILVFG